MSNLPNGHSRRQPGGGESSPISRDFSRPRPGPEVVGKRLSGEGFFFPRELRQLRPSGSVLDVFEYLEGQCVRFAHCGVWPSTATIARDLDMPVRTVQVALKWLEDRGWIARVVESYRGRDITVIWCRWLIPPDDLAGRDCLLGHGLKIRGEDARVVPTTPRRPAASDRADFGASRADPGASRADSPREVAPKSAPDIEEELKTGETLTLTRLRPGGDRSKSPDAPPDPPAVPIDPPPPPAPPVPAPRELTPPADCYAALAAPWCSRPAAAAGFLWDLVDQGQAVPESWRDRMPPRPEPDPPASAPPAPSRPATSRPATAAAPSTLDRLRRLASPAGPEAVAAALKGLPGEVARELGDEHSVNYYAKLLGGVAAGEVRLKSFLTAFEVARKSTTARKKGAIFADKFRSLAGAGA